MRLLDRRLNFRAHITECLKKAKGALSILARLGGVRKGMTGMAVGSMCLREVDRRIWS